VTRRDIRASISVLLAGHLCCAAAVAQKRSQRDEVGLVGPVRTVRVYRADVLVQDGKRVEGPRTLSETMVFDAVGRLLESADYLPGGATDTKSTWKYDDAGREVEHCSYVHDDLVDRYVSTYDEKGRIRERLTYGHSGKLDRKEVYQFSSTGRQARVTEYKQGDVTGTGDETYDEQGRLLERSGRREPSNPEKYVYTYDAAGNKTSEVHQYTSKGGRHESKSVYFFGEDGRLREEAVYQDGALSGRETYQYDARRNRIRIVTHKANGEIREALSVAYEYAADGNWSKATITLAAPDPNDAALQGYVAYRTVTFGGDKSVELWLAATNGDLNGVKTAIDQGVDINAKDSDGRTAMVLASRAGHAAIVQLLMSKGAQFEAKDAEGLTALMCASAQGSVEIVKLLLASGADLNARTRDDGTALTAAVTSGNIEIVGLLLSKGADINAKARGGTTPLMVVALIGQAEMARFLIQNGAEVNAKSQDGVTPLMFAAESCNVEIAKILLDNGADVNAKDSDGKTALDAATKTRRDDMIKLLKEAKTIK
jgi:ankyrin repeat protein